MIKYFRKVIRIEAKDSPNVRFAEAQRARGIAPTDEIVTPGVLSWSEYCHRRKHWDKVRQTVGLDAKFYKGAEILLYPPDWLDRANRRHRQLRAGNRQAKGVGCDPGEGTANTAMAACDEHGLIELVSFPTQDTSVIGGNLLAFMARHGAAPDEVCIDAGGGGHQIADQIQRDAGIAIRQIRFGAAPSLKPRRASHAVTKRIDILNQRYAYVNLRAQMFWELRMLLDPHGDAATSAEETFALPDESFGEAYERLRKQLAVVPIHHVRWNGYDKEGRFRLPPKNKNNPDSTELTLTELMGCSPDEADAVVLAVHGMLHEDARPTAGGF